MSQEFSFFATCPRYMEQLLADELASLGIEDSKQAIGGVAFSTTQQRAYRVCLWSRLANRVLMQLTTVTVRDKEQVYAAAAAINWREHIQSNERNTAKIVVDFNGTSNSIRNSQFGAQVVKDAIVDQFSSATRPAISKQFPDIRINAHLAKGKITIALDLSGESLHRRAYRAGAGEAPLKENLAAAILIRAGWPAYCSQSEKPAVLLDPMCGSGTLLFEAAMMAYDCAPGLLREHWGFTAWKQHDQQAWASILSEAEQRLRTAETERRAVFLGYDKDKNVLAQAQKTARRLGLGEHFDFELSAIEQLKCPEQHATGMLISNPPYGERLGELRELENLYATLGGHLKEYFAGWQVAIYGANTELLDELRLRANKKYRLRNGPLEGQLRLFTIAAPLESDENAAHGRAEQNTRDVKQREPLRLGLPKVADELANRLKKNQQRLSKAARKMDSNCYRLYDADIPEYSSAIDVYADHVLVTEYAAPDSIDEKKARQRFQNTVATVEAVTGVEKSKVISKQKRRQKGNDQYQRSGRGSELLEVKEGQARLLVNLHDYHDSGLFLDHRPVRRLLAEKARGKRFLNLFCYTAAATVQVALAGAKESTSVDMSAPYLAWARKNMQLNDISPYGHQFIQADCLKWLADCEQQYDLILLDPPSFSNSKRMDDVLDIQRDHAALIDRCVQLLAPNGELVFSTNRRKFKMDADLHEDFAIRDVTQSTLDPDFQRSSPAHRCWLISHGV